VLAVERHAREPVSREPFRLCRDERPCRGLCHRLRGTGLSQGRNGDLRRFADRYFHTSSRTATMANGFFIFLLLSMCLRGGYTIGSLDR
jgi:hypothetical protein